MQEPKEESKEESKKASEKSKILPDSSHLGSSNAFEETENTLSRDADNISDEKLDDLLEDH